MAIAKHRFKQLVRTWVAPGIVNLARQSLNYFRPAPWEYVPDGWRSKNRGWNVPAIAELHESTWPSYTASLDGAAILTFNHENPSEGGNLWTHNTLITYGYVLGLAAWENRRISILDWGGGMGHYYVLSRALMPADLQIDYTCYDLPVFCEAGRRASPDVSFFERRDEALAFRYDLVLASSSIWYEEDWRSLISRLASVAVRYLYVTRMIFIDRETSYVAIQRPSLRGYRTEYLCWILNRQEFLDQVLSQGMRLVREFLVCEAEHIHGALEQGEYRGFLFSRT